MNRIIAVRVGAAVFLAATLGTVAGCDLDMQTSGAPCPVESKFAQDGTYILKCTNGVWTPGLDVATGDALLAKLKATLARNAAMRDSWANCTEVRNAGVQPILRGERGYAPKLDRDNDGQACEDEV